ncbi:MAG TPA: 3-deoxy-manno-octulosonate cytidylyltransferase [Planctomycetota bacterium]|nr:3-deoxy-manno-octulosonate cytidylyltransferase [Planctomycetota bacterium]
MARRPSVVAVIPARFAAVRLPGKPLLNETGKYLVQHVWERVIEARRVTRVLIATDDERIARAAKSFGAEVAMTAAALPNGTSRCAAAVRKIACDHVINIQGDEPDIDPATIDRCAALLNGCEMSTAATTFLRPEEESNPSRVKVVLDRAGYALYFSRARIPSAGPTLLHLGLYGYTRRFLVKLARLPATPLSEQERLEQLRVLENGHRIRVAVVDTENPGGIDTPADYAAFVARYKGRLQK